MSMIAKVIKNQGGNEVKFAQIIRKVELPNWVGDR
jgi:hypothetical protein